MEDLLKSREFLQQQIATTEAQLSQLNAALERTERQIAVGRPTTATTTTNQPETVNKGEVPSERNRRYPLEQDEYRRYGRQMIVDQIGLDGQLKLRESSVLIVGAGGLGCPAAMYLAGAGVGTIGIIDGDTVEESNLHRQVLHRTRNVGKFKVDSAIQYLKEYVILLSILDTQTSHQHIISPD
ncbi:molybdenum cofactor biosynthetic protein [Histoplasma capsulatum H143]|uniref:Molybdenum cofactor biosynthetic protein n=1 Tax=Ajellomyces capsulatus (strain H143) TaxID=544712 RepID=C6HS59_AJECH|nr:molybdenum cofactor biosynthetic protein [Histoplasma capsulatum H143]